MSVVVGDNGVREAVPVIRVSLIGINDKICTISGQKRLKSSSAKRSSRAKQNLWAQLASTAKRSYNMLSVMRESRRAQESRPRPKHEISSLSETFVSCQAQRTTGAKPKSTYSR